MQIRTVSDLRRALMPFAGADPVQVRVRGRTVRALHAMQDGRTLVLDVAPGVARPTPAETAARRNEELRLGER